MDCTLLHSPILQASGQPSSLPSSTSTLNSPLSSLHFHFNSPYPFSYLEKRHFFLHFIDCPKLFPMKTMTVNEHLIVCKIVVIGSSYGRYFVPYLTVIAVLLLFFSVLLVIHLQFLDLLHEQFIA